MSQSVVVQPHWRFVVDESGVFSVEMQIELDTSVAQKREQIAHALLKDAAKVLVAIRFFFVISKPVNWSEVRRTRRQGS